MEIDPITRHIGAEFQMARMAFRKAEHRKDDYIGIREAARRASMSEKTIRKLIRNDALPHYRGGKSGKILLRWADFVEWMERRKIILKHDDRLLSILRDMGKAG